MFVNIVQISVVNFNVPIEHCFSIGEGNLMSVSSIRTSDEHSLDVPILFQVDDDWRVALFDN